jgi:hypothetical protein
MAYNFAWLKGKGPGICSQSFLKNSTDCDVVTITLALLEW